MCCKFSLIIRNNEKKYPVKMVIFGKFYCFQHKESFCFND